MNITRRQAEGHDLALVVDDDMQLEAIEPAHGGMTALGNIRKRLVFVDALVVTNGKRSGIDVVKACLIAGLVFEKHAQGGQDAAFDFDKSMIRQQVGEF